MAGGYAKGFIIEHDPTLRKRMSCRDCVYYEESDCSCLKAPLYLPEDGYDMWRICDYVELSKQVDNYDGKLKDLKAKRKGHSPVEDENPANIPFDDFPKIGKYIRMLPLSYLSVSKRFKKYTVTPDKVQSVKEYYNINGIVDKPVIVAQVGERYQVVNGYARYIFAKEVGLKEIPVVLNKLQGRARYNLCKKNTNVFHKSYGEGIIERYDLLYITVYYPEIDKTEKLNIDACIERGIIKRRRSKQLTKDTNY